MMLISPTNPSFLAGLVPTVHAGLAAMPWILATVAYRAGRRVQAGWIGFCVALAELRTAKLVPGPAPKPGLAVSMPTPLHAIGVTTNLAPATSRAVAKGGTRTLEPMRKGNPEGFEARLIVSARVPVGGPDCAHRHALGPRAAVRGYLKVRAQRQALVTHVLHAAVRPGAALSNRGSIEVLERSTAADRAAVLLTRALGITPVIHLLSVIVAAHFALPVSIGHLPFLHP